MPVWKVIRHELVLKRGDSPLGPQIATNTKGDHFIYTMDGVEEIINIQPAGRLAKPYQVKQVRGIILKYQMGGVIVE